MLEIDIYNKALNQYGSASQHWMLIEEMGELLNAIAKIKRGRTNIMDIITELADVHIMVEQMAFYYGYDSFLRERERKIKRLKERLENK